MSRAPPLTEKIEMMFEIGTSLVRSIRPATRALARLMLICLLTLGASTARAATEHENLAVEQKHLQWLEEVSYIITNKERDAFLALTDNESRDQFIEIFWRARDPTPGTAINEYRDEHYRRLEYANKFLGRDTSRPGWKTDRGRIYILLGKPRSTHRYPSELTTKESELWFYDSLTLPGVPPFLYVLFYKPDLGAEMKLFTPGQDELRELLIGSTQMQSDEMAAYQHLRDIDPELAHAALSMRPGESDEVHLSRSSFDALVVARIAESPERSVDTSYVNRLELGKEAIELEYAFTYIPMGFIARAYQYPGVGLMVDYALEILPRDLTLLEYNDEYLTGFNLIGAIIDDKKRQAATIDEQAEIHLKAKELAQIRQRPLNLHGRAIGLPGRYIVSLLLKSQTTKQYARGEDSLSIADPAKTEIWMSKPLLCYRVEQDAKVSPKMDRAFQFGTYRVYPRVGGDFSRGEKAWVYVQLYSSKLSQKDVVANKLSVEVLDPTGKTVKSAELLLSEAVLEGNGRVHAAPMLQLDAIEPGTYEVHCAVLKPDGTKKIDGTTTVKISAGGSAGTPWLLSREQIPADDPSLIVERARGYLALGQPEAAVKLLEAIPESAEKTGSTLLLQSYLRMNQPQKVLDHFETGVASALYSEGKLDFETSMKCEGIADAHIRLGHWQNALLYLDRISRADDPRPELLFKLARCHRELGHIEQATQLQKKACEIDPEAPECSSEQRKDSR